MVFSQSCRKLLWCLFDMAATVQRPKFVARESSSLLCQWTFDLIFKFIYLASSYELLFWSFYIYALIIIRGIYLFLLLICFRCCIWDGWDTYTFYRTLDQPLVLLLLPLEFWSRYWDSFLIMIWSNLLSLGRKFIFKSGY